MTTPPTPPINWAGHLKDVSFTERLDWFIRGLCPECGGKPVNYGHKEWPYCFVHGNSKTESKSKPDNSMPQS